MGESFWQKDSLITHILFELWLITHLGLLRIFMRQTLEQLKFKLEKIIGIEKHAGKVRKTFV